MKSLLLLSREEKIKWLNDLRKGKIDLEEYDNGKAPAWEYFKGADVVISPVFVEGAKEIQIDAGLVRAMKKAGQEIVFS